MPDKCRYDAGVEVPAGFVPRGPDNIVTLPGGRYAAMHYEGRSDAIVGAWAARFREWLPDSGLRVDERPCFEYYPADGKVDPASGIFECKLCIPVCAK